MDTITYYYQYLSTTYTGFPLVVRIALLLIFMMGILYLLSWINIGLVAFMKKRDNRRTKKIKKYTEQVNQIINSTRNYSETEILEILSIKPPIPDWMKIHISEYLVDKIDTSESNHTNIGTLLYALRIPEYWENEIDAGKASRQWKSIRMLDNLSPFVAASVISKKATSERKDIGNYARSVFAKFDSHDAFKFLSEDIDSDNFTELDKLRIHNSLKSHNPKEVLPHLLRTALNTSNDNYRIFLINEIQLLGITEGLDSLLDLYKTTKNADVKAQIIKTLSVLDFKEAIPIFIHDYNFAKSRVQEEIIEGLGRMGGTEALNFLEKIYSETNNKELLVKILQNIYMIEKDKSENSVFRRLQSMNKSEFNRKAFSYVENQY